MRFSQRIGKRLVKTVSQIDGMDDDLRIRLWNVILTNFINNVNDNTSYNQRESYKGSLLITIWINFLNKPIDKIPRNFYKLVDIEDVIKIVSNWFGKAEWYDAYDFIEYLAELSDSFKASETFIEACNGVLELETSGYRIINSKIVQITSEEEVQAIEDALTESEQWKPVNTHLQTALDLLADRKNPDYRNSIKESISAIEALCTIITGVKSATLGKALNKVEDIHPLHGSLKAAFSSLYGYTSEADGIRHRLLEDDGELRFEDAKFMLVACSAFVNYLKAKMEV